MRRSVLGVIFAVFLGATTAAAVDDIQGAGAVWSDFVASLKRGDYINAHGLFSAQSRGVMPYREFVAEYGPLSAAREMVLAKPDSQATNLDGDWAELVFGGVNPGTGRKFKVGVTLVKNQGAWGLVAARNEEVERLEAAARGLIRLLWDNRMHGKPRDLVTTLTRAQEGNPVFARYRLETDGKTFRAFPLDQAYRTFYVDEWGEVRAIEQSVSRRAPAEMTPHPERSALPSSPPIPDAGRASAERGGTGDGMPELTEPGDWDESGRGGPESEFAEPPMPGASSGGSRLPSSPPSLSLPDTIR